MSQQLRSPRTRRGRRLAGEPQPGLSGLDLPLAAAPTAAATVHAPNLGDSDWEMESENSDEDPEFAPVPDSDDDTALDDSDDEIDYVNLHDSSIDSDEPIGSILLRHAERNAPGQPGFVWRQTSNLPRRYGFSGMYYSIVLFVFQIFTCLNSQVCINT